jgi:hypothetical protein
MKNWTKKEALNAIQELINQVNFVIKSEDRSQHHMRWLANTLRILEEVFGANSRYYLTIQSFSWQITSGTIIQSYDIESAIAHKNYEAFIKQMNQAKGILFAAIDHLTQSKIEDVYEGKNTPDETNDLFMIITSDALTF